MANAKTYILSVAFIFFGTHIAFGQKTILDSPFDLELLEGNILEILSELELSNDLRFSYGSNSIDLNKHVVISTNASTLGKLIDFLFDGKIIPLETTHRKIILVPVMDAEYQYISGFVKDELTGDPISQALIIDQTTQKTYLCNNDGYFIYKKILQDTSAIEVRYLGYKSKVIRGDFANEDILIEMTSDISFPDIVISDKKIPGRNPDIDERVFLSEASLFPSLMGEKDLLQSLKKYPALISGGEGQNGFLVRGGSTDQNLVLLEGVPVYEISHLGGISSILVTDAIRKADFISSGFPAKYGGRISSVVDVKLKEGNSKKATGNIQTSMMGIKAALRGPLGQANTTFSVAGRASWFDKLLGPIVRRNAELTAADLNYNDLLAKVTHYFNPATKLSISAYRGSDRIDVTQSQIVLDSITELDFINNNEITWSNQFVNIDWSSSISSQLYVNIKAYAYAYNFNSTARYNFEILNDDVIIDREYLIISSSNINDRSVNLDASYYFSNNHKLDFGGSAAYQTFNPRLRQTDELPEDDETATKYYKLYADESFKMNEDISLNFGLHLSVFDNEKTYFSLEPRFNLNYAISDIHHLSLSGSKMTQNIHLLTNPGIGLPSDLWVPSTKNVKPQSAYEVSLLYALKSGSKFNFTLSGYYKRLRDLIDYQTNTDVFFLFLNDANYIPPTNSVNNWEDLVNIGSGRAYGVEFYSQYNSNKVKSWFSYSYGISNRTFEGINKGIEFPYKYDYRHDINIGALYRFSKNMSCSALWVFNTGRRTSLATDQARLADGTLVLIPPDRNNFKFPDFHHLDINLEYKKTLKELLFKLNFGIYNSYNRFNPFYLYLVEEEAPNKFTPKQLSIFPLLPQISAELQF